MRGLLKKLVVLAILALAVYVPLFSVKLPEPGEIVVTESRETGRVTAVFSGKVCFVPQGSLFWLYRVYTLSCSRTVDFSVTVPVPPLQYLKSDHFAVKIPLRLDYRIRADSIFDINILSDFGERLDDYCKKQTGEIFSKELDRFFRPAYQPAALELAIDEVVGSVFKTEKEELEGRGIEIVSLKRGGNAHVPDGAQYTEGLKYLGELRALEHENAIAVMKLENDVALGKITDEEYYKKLIRISKILKQNPDIIRYIYIDKILGNVKLIIPSDVNGVLKGLGKGSAAAPDGEIDNLR